jgi:hypothetical protein
MRKKSQQLARTTIAEAFARRVSETRPSAIPALPPGRGDAARWSVDPAKPFPEFASARLLAA